MFGRTRPFVSPHWTIVCFVKTSLKMYRIANFETGFCLRYQNTKWRPDVVFHCFISKVTFIKLLEKILIQCFLFFFFLDIEKEV